MKGEVVSCYSFFLLVTKIVISLCLQSEQVVNSYQSVIPVNAFSLSVLLSQHSPKWDKKGDSKVKMQ